MASPDPNRFASSAESGYLRGSLASGKALEASLAAQLARSGAALHDAERAVADALETRASVKESHDTILRMHADVARSNMVKAGLLHPIRNLPDEVLSEIFLAFLVSEAARYPDDSDEQWHHLCLVPDTVARVSQRWRSVSLDTPRLWRYISIVFLDDLDAMRGPWIRSFQTRIARSGTVPVKLLIRGPFPPYDDEGSWAVYGERGAQPPWTRGFWEPLISVVPRCQAIRVVFCSTNVDLTDMGPLLRGDAPLLEDLAVCLAFAEGYDPFVHEDITGSSPRFKLCVRAPNLRRVQLGGVLPSMYHPQDDVVYPRLAHAVIMMNDDFTVEHARALLPRFPALASLDLRSIYHAPPRVSLAWFAHTSVKHLALDFIFQQNSFPEPQAFPLLESADFTRAGHAWDLESVFAPTSAFHALRSLRILVPYYDAELVCGLDVLPRLESAFLSGGALTPSFVALETWRHRAGWRCPALERMVLDEVRERQPVAPDSILAWPRERNSSAQGGKHKAFRHFSIKWETRPQSLSLDFEEHISRLLDIS